MLPDFLFFDGRGAAGDPVHHSFDGGFLGLIEMLDGHVSQTTVTQFDLDIGLFNPCRTMPISRCPVLESTMTTTVSPTSREAAAIFKGVTSRGKSSLPTPKVHS